MAVELSSTHCHQVLAPTRTEVSSEPTTALSRTAAAIGATAVMNALMDALAQAGVRHVDMPATPEIVWRAAGRA